jgi:UDP-glucose 4-epimerase
MPRYAITGGAGFIGSHIAEEIVVQGLGNVIVFDDLSSGHEHNLMHLKEHVHFIKGDIRDRAALETAFAGCDIVFHEAAFVSAFDSYNKPELTNEINVLGTMNVLDCALKAGVRRVVLASSAAVYGTESMLPNREDMPLGPESPYAIAKASDEFYARMFSRQKGLETVCLRYFNVFGPRQDPASEYSGVISRFLDAIRLSKRPVIYGDGLQTRDFIAVQDVARANILAAHAPACGAAEVINIGTGRETSLLDVLHALEKALGRELNAEFRASREGDIRRSVACVDRARERLQFEAQADFDAGVAALVASLNQTA